jgi:hypothetical protein
MWSSASSVAAWSSGVRVHQDGQTIVVGAEIVDDAFMVRRSFLTVDS